MPLALQSFDEQEQELQAEWPDILYVPEDVAVTIVTDLHINGSFDIGSERYAQYVKLNNAEHFVNLLSMMKFIGIQSIKKRECRWLMK